MDVSRWIVAYHEAGHVVAAFAVHHPVEYATIMPNESMAGHVAIMTDFDDAYSLYRRIIITLAGGMAESIIGDAHEATEHARKDMIDADVCIIKRYQMTHGGTPTRDVADFYKKESSAIVLRYWTAVDAIAAALLEQTTIDGGVLHTLFVQSLEEQGNL